MDSSSILSAFAPEPLLLGLLILAGVVSSLLAAHWMRNRLAVERKLAQITEQRAIGAESVLLLNKKQTPDLSEGLLLKILPTLANVRALLRAAGLKKISVATYTLTVLIGAVAVSWFFSLPSVPEALEPVPAVFLVHFILVLLLSWLARRRKRKIAAQLAVAVEYVVRGVRVGQSLEAAIGDAAEIVESPLRDELLMIQKLVDVGVPLADAVTAVAYDLDAPEFDFFATAISAQMETGGSIARTLTNLVNVIRDRTQLELKVAALSAEGKVSALILAALPILIFVYLLYVSPDYVEPLFRTEAGSWILYGAFGLIAVGTAVMLRLARIRV